MRCVAGLSPPMQSATQLAAGLLFCGLFVVVRRLTFPLSCLVAITFTADMLILAADNHMGSRIKAAAAGVGPFVWGAVAGGGVLSLALACGRPGTSPHTAVVCVLGVLGLALLVPSRACLAPKHPPHVWIGGMLSVRAFGVALIAGQFNATHGSVWRGTVGGLARVAVLSSAAAALAGALVLPSLAADEMRADAGASVRAIGHAASRFASRVLQRQAREQGHGPNGPEARAGRPGLTPAVPSLPPASPSPATLQHQQQLVPNALDQLQTTSRAHQLDDDTCGGRQGEAPAPRVPSTPPSPFQAEPVSSATAIALRQGSSNNNGSSSSSSSSSELWSQPSDTFTSSSSSHDLGAPAAGPPEPVVATIMQQGPQPLSSLVSVPLQQQGASLPLTPASVGQLAMAVHSIREGHQGNHERSGGDAAMAHDQDASPVDAHHPHHDAVEDADATIELSLEDKDAFLQMLRDATAPRLPPHITAAATPHPHLLLQLLHGRRGRRRRRSPSIPRLPPPPLSAPPGGLLPSALARFSAAIVSVTDTAVTAAAAAARDAAAAGGESMNGGGGGSVPYVADEAGVPGAGPVGTYGGGGVGTGGRAVAWAPVAALRPLLVRARACRAAAEAEPPWVIQGPADLERWSGLLTAAEVLLTRVAALDCLLEEKQQVLGDGSLAALLGADVIAPYRMAYGRVAASCAVLGEALAASTEKRLHSCGRAVVCRCRGSGAEAWAVTHREVQVAMRRAWVAYWQLVRERLEQQHQHQEQGALRAAAVAGVAVAPLLPVRTHASAQSASVGVPVLMSIQQSRALNYLWAVTEGVLCAMVQLEAAALRALAVDGQKEAPGQAQQQQRNQQQEQHQEQTAHGQSQRQQRKPCPVEEGGGLAGSCSTPPTGGTAPEIGVGKRAGTCGAAGRPACGRQGGGEADGSRGHVTGQLQTLPEQVGGDTATIRDQGELQEQQEQRQQPQLGVGRNRECVALEIGGGGEGAGEGLAAAAGVRARAVRGARGHWVAALGAAGRTVRATWLWQRPLWKVAVGLPMLRTLPRVTWHALRVLLRPRHRGERRELVTSRPFQFGLKYWMSSVMVLLALLLLAAAADQRSQQQRQQLRAAGSAGGVDPARAGPPPQGALQLFRDYPMSFAFIATTMSMTERVESTLSRAAMRALGTVAGGSVALGVLLHGGLRSSAVGVVGLTCGLGFLVGCQSRDKLSYMLVLALLTFQALVLCPYGSACCRTTHDALRLYGVRVLSVLVSCTLPVVVARVVWPWFTSDWALETMAGTCTANAVIIRSMYNTYYQDHMAAHVASHGAAATAAVLRSLGLDQRPLRRLLLTRHHHDMQHQQQQTEQSQGQEQEQVVPGGQQQQRQLQLEAGQQHRPAGYSPGAVEAPQAATSGDGAGIGACETAGAGVGQRPADSGSASSGLPASTADGSSSTTEIADGGNRGGVGGEGSGEEEGSQLRAPRVALAAADQGLAAGLAAEAEDAAEAGQPEVAQSLQALVSGPLLAVQSSLMRDTAVWTRGVYAVPRLVPLVLHHQLLAAERLAALQLVVADAPGLWGEAPPAAGGGNSQHVVDVGSGDAKGMEGYRDERGAGKGEGGSEVGACSSSGLAGGSAPPGEGTGGSGGRLGSSSREPAGCGTGRVPQGGGRLSGAAFGVLVAPLHGVATDTLDALCHVCDLTAALLDPRRSGKSGHNHARTLVCTVMRTLAALCGRASRSVGQWLAGRRGQHGPPAGVGAGRAGAASGNPVEPGGSTGVGGAGAWQVMSEAAAGRGRTSAAAAGGGAREGRQEAADEGGGGEPLVALAAAIQELDLRRLKMRQRVHAMRHALHAGVSGMGAGGSGTHSGSSSSGSSGIIGVRKQDAGRVNTADRNRGRQVGAPAAVEVEEGEETAGSPGSGVDGGRPVGHRMQQQQQQQEQPPLWADVVAVNATLYALVKAVDRATATARAVLQYNERRRDRGHGLQDGAGWW